MIQLTMIQLMDIVQGFCLEEKKEKRNNEFNSIAIRIFGNKRIGMCGGLEKKNALFIGSEYAYGDRD